MLFAVTIDCPDPVALAAFYQAFLGGEMRSSNPDFVVLTSENGGVRLDFQRVGNPEPPAWPDPDAPRRVHLDIQVDDLDQAERQVIDLGARLASHQPGGRRYRVFLDPAGHPFCLATPDAANVPSTIISPP
ncbi:VOC family protein [Actinomadura rupiterrae]|uniref:VOC family protein n=1 Tax=Actinomadura rupiterrae TaxID=559627 RepID=UPI0020A40EB2|nr:VOC family protein [Actinomadura rupiterrae]MCP2340632.1 catechol 2,3-dioxygenase-like lactoylglutathione lyase family enzyme [Actinomadura rupiterrae]